MKRLCLILYLCLLPLLAAAQPVSAPSVDFSRQMLTAWGLGGMPWENSTSMEEERSRAWMSALHRAYEAVLALPLMEGMEVRNALEMNPALKERLGMMLLSAPKTFYQPDVTGLLRCKLEVPFSGAVSLRSSLYLAALRPQPMEPRVFLASWSVLATEPAELSSEKEIAVHRIVMDLRHQNFEPSLFPRFFSTAGRILFQEAQIPQPERFSRPAVRFSTNIRDAYKGCSSNEVLFVRGRIPPLGGRDIKILPPEDDMFLRFCRAMTDTPMKDREILIIWKPSQKTMGSIPLKKEEKAAQPKGKTGKK